MQSPKAVFGQERFIRIPSLYFHLTKNQLNFFKMYALMSNQFNEHERQQPQIQNSGHFL
jgi:hypothetical protein